MDSFPFYACGIHIYIYKYTYNIYRFVLGFFCNSDFSSLPPELEVRIKPTCILWKRTNTSPQQMLNCMPHLKGMQGTSVVEKKADALVMGL